MNIVGYVNKYGKKKFSELPFNEIDALIFAELAYINFDHIIKDISFKKLKELVIKDKKAFYFGSVDANGNRKLLEAMMKSPRYENVKVGYCQSKVNKKTNEQFYALTIIMPNREAYIAFRGTDVTLSGWREDLLMAFQDNIPGQKSALKYIKNAVTLFKGRFYIGGHSKGGNLAIYAALSMGEKNEERLIKAYSFDGPGFRNGIEEQPAFKRLEGRLEKFLTTHDMIGVIYNNFANPKIVYSTGVLLGGHDPFYWEINERKMLFRYAKDRSLISKGGEEALMNFLRNESDESKQVAVTVISDLLGESETIYDLLLNAGRSIKRGKSVLDNYTDYQKESAKEIFKKLGRYYLLAYSPKRFLMNRFKKKDEEETE